MEPSAQVLQKIKIKLIINIFARLCAVGGAEIKTIDRALWFRGAGADKAKGFPRTWEMRRG